ncbi:unnamed protein product [Polarella glacialis]|uniref:DUF4116 domain-containing protein n=1 Tax=Polarella glacialis TaxID=89957 RepID=A0A813J7W9_POLGL|nr:unnamed protein product [Polarella glacialis]
MTGTSSMSQAAAIDLVKRDGLALQQMPEHLRADQDVVLAAISQEGFALEFAAPCLRENRDFVLAAVRLDGFALRFAAKELRSDLEVVLSAVTQNGASLGFAAKELQAVRGVVLAAVRTTGSALQFAPAGLRAQRDVVLVALRKDGLALEFVAQELRAEKDVVLTAVIKDGAALQFASKELRSDEDVVMAAVEQNGAESTDRNVPRDGSTGSALQLGAPTMMGPGPGPMSYASSAPMQQQHSGGQMPMQMVLMPVAMGPMGMGSGAEGLSGIASAPSVPPSAAELAVRLPDRGARWPQGICGPAPVGPLRGPAGLGQQAPSAPGGIVIMQGEIPHMGVPGLCGGGGGAAIGAPPLAPQPQTLTRAFSVKSGFFRVHWTVDARKLRGNDKQAVSPPFELSFGSQFPNVTFKMMIYPKVDERYGVCVKFKLKNVAGVPTYLGLSRAVAGVAALLRFALHCAERYGRPYLEAPLEVHHGFFSRFHAVLFVKSGCGCREELLALRPEAEALSVGTQCSAITPAMADASTPAAAAARDMPSLRQDLKRKKFMYLAVEAQLCFARSVFANGAPAGSMSREGRDMEAARREAKMRNKALNRNVAQELEEHSRLCQELTRTHKQSQQLDSLCEEELQELQELAEEDAEAVALADRSLTPEELAAGPSIEAKRLKSDDPEALLAQLLSLEAQELAEVEQLEALELFEQQLGLPRIDIDSAKGVLVLGRQDCQRKDDATLRTIKVERNGLGKLLRAETHPSLGLWNEATGAVEADDLGRLLTLAWDRIRGMDSEIASAGG